MEQVLHQHRPVNKRNVNDIVRQLGLCTACFRKIEGDQLWIAFVR